MDKRSGLQEVVVNGERCLGDVCGDGGSPDICWYYPLLGGQRVSVLLGGDLTTGNGAWRRAV